MVECHQAPSLSIQLPFTKSVVCALKVLIIFCSAMARQLSHISMRTLSCPPLWLLGAGLMVFWFLCHIVYETRALKTFCLQTHLVPCIHLKEILSCILVVIYIIWLLIHPCSWCSCEKWFLWTRIGQCVLRKHQWFWLSHANAGESVWPWQWCSHFLLRYYTIIMVWIIT